MSVFEAVILGIIQGIGEFLPISSSGHLVIIPQLFGWKDQGLDFDVILHFGTLIAIIIYFGKDWYKIIKDGLTRPKSEDGRFLWLLVLATVPAAIIGKTLEPYVEANLRSPYLVASNLIIFALILLFADRKAPQNNTTVLNVKNALFLGFAQALALFPGTSRSGITITCALLLGFNRTTAARISFLMATPIIAGAAVLKAPVLVSASADAALWAGFFSALVVGWLSIKFLMALITKYDFRIFVVYRILLGTFIFIWFLIR